MNDDGKVHDTTETKGENDNKIENGGPVPGNHLGGLAQPSAKNRKSHGGNDQDGLA